MKRSLLILAALFLAFSFAHAVDPVPLLIPGADNLGWSFDNGREFPGATGSLSIDPSQKHDNQDSLKLHGDFTKGGNYVRVSTSLDTDIHSISMWLKTADTESIGMRIIDSTGQCHQIGFKLQRQADWQKFDFPLEQFFAKAEGIGGNAVARYESWGGANDQKWHGPAKEIDILVSPSADKKVIDLWLSGATILPPAPEMRAGAPSFKTDFEGSGSLPPNWTSEGNVAIDTTDAFKGKNSLALSRSSDEFGKPLSATGPAFKITPGSWKIDIACKSDLKSPDTSFDGVVTLEYLSGGSVVDQVTLADIFGQHPWQSITKQVQPPSGADSARIHIQVNKAFGKFWVDEISAARLSAVTHQPSPIDRMYFSHDGHGHLLYPTDSRAFKVTVETTRPMAADKLTASCVVTDYWGAEEGDPVKVQFTQASGMHDGRTVYEGNVDFSSLPLETGKYYEIHGEIPQGDDEPYRNYSSFAIEPEAAANSYKASEIPFSGRNWDGRIAETFEISHRLGIRIMCLWSGWDANPPYTPHAPCIDIVQKYGMGAIFGAQSGTIDTRQSGWEKYDDTALREGTRNMIQTYRKMAEPFIISLGNEPPVNKDWIPDDVKAYKSVYESAKATDPSVTVIGTSIGPNEEFFKGGFGKYCDAYDFHCYESPQDVTNAFVTYKKMFARYGDTHPVWSTEIGLNSQGVGRNIVAIDMIKKFTLFFAGGGTNMSWFDLFYPDGDGKLAGGSGDAHDTFSGRYLQYAPKLTGVTYYDLINAICIKKFIAQKEYADGIHAYLFRDSDNRQLQVIWKDKGRQDVFLPLPGAKTVQVIRIAGDHPNLNPGSKGVTLTVGEDPMLLLYDGPAPLAEKLGDPAATVIAPADIVRAASTDITVQLSGAAADDVNLIAPPFWQVQKTASGSDVKFSVTCPENSTVREADLAVTIGSKDNTQGELFLRPPVTGQISETVTPVPAVNGKPPGVKLIVKNNGQKKQDISWDLSLVNQLPLIDGKYEATTPVTDTHFTETPNGQATIDGGAEQDFVIPLAGVDSQTAYRVHANVTDSTDRVTASERYVAGFVDVPRATGKINLNGTLDSPDWKKAPVEKIDEKRQYFSFKPELASWKGPKDLSGTIRFLWDDKYLYVGVEVTDDVFVGGKPTDLHLYPGVEVTDHIFAGGKPTDLLWQQDGLQFLIDPCRGMNESVGKYDYAAGVGKNGPGAWCYLSADAGAPSGEAKDVIVSAKRKDTTTGDMTYVVAFPWSRVAPFKPAPGADLGLTMLLNEDDGKGRNSFMSWFGNAATKQVDAVGDLILSK